MLFLRLGYVLWPSWLYKGRLSGGHDLKSEPFIDLSIYLFRRFTYFRERESVHLQQGGAEEGRALSSTEHGARWGLKITTSQPQDHDLRQD